MSFPQMRQAAQRGGLLNKLAFAIALLMPNAVFAADPGDKATRYYEDGLQRFEKRDLMGAIIQLKNALQQDARMLSAQILLAKVYLRAGDASGAEEALNRALHLGVDRSEVIVPMAQAYLGQGKHKILLERLVPEGLPLKHSIDLLVLRAEAQTELRDFAAAQRTLDAARAIDSRSVTVIAAEAALRLTQGDRVGAAKLADQAATLAPQDPKAWSIKATIAHAAGDLHSAISAYSKSIALDPAESTSRIARASIFLELDQLGEAGRDIEVLRKGAEGDPRAAYIDAVYLSRRGDASGATAALREVTKIADAVQTRVLVSRPQLTLLGGLAHYGLNQHAEAKAYLEKYVDLDKRHAGARKVLAALYLHEGNAKAAIAALEPAYRVSPRDYRLLSLLATAYIMQRQYAKANGLLEQAIEYGGSDSEIQTQLGFSLLAKGDGDIALEHLRRAFAKDSTQSRVGAALVMLNIRRGQARQALEVAEKLAAREPNDATSHNLLGVARVAAGDRKGGRTAYERAIDLNKSYAPAHLNLGMLDVAENKPNAGRDRLLAVLRTQPRSTSAMFELARLEDSVGNTEEAIHWLDKVRAVDARNANAARILVEVHLRNSDASKAIAVAKEIATKAPDDLGVLLTLGRAHIAAGDHDSARIALSRMTKLAEFDHAWQVEIARQQLAANNPTGAAYSLDKALTSKPDFLPALAMLTEVEIASGELTKAEQRARFALSRFPTLAVGHRLLADVALAKRIYGDAVAGYRTALAKEETIDGALYLYRAYVESGDVAKARDLMESWVRKHPRDTNLILALADAYLRLGKLHEARTTYENHLKLAGDNALALNNLANILMRQGDAGALAYAERAQRLAPDDAGTNDTLGWVVLHHGQLERGLRLLRDARLRDPNSREIRFHLAEALKRAGRREEAKQELEPAMRDSVAFDGDVDAKKLWQDLTR